MARDAEDQKKRNLHAHRADVSYVKATYRDGSFEINATVKASNLHIDNLVYVNAYRHSLHRDPAQDILDVLQEGTIIEEPAAPSLPTLPARLIDCLCKPDEAEEIIGDLKQQFAARSDAPQYRMVWLWCQVTRIAFEEAMKLLRLYTQARTGK